MDTRTTCIRRKKTATLKRVTFYAGVYRLRHRKTRDCYVGSSNNLHARAGTHFDGFANTHECKVIADLIKWAGPDFDFKVLEVTDDYIARERVWIEKLKPTLNTRMRPGKTRRLLREPVLTVNFSIDMTSPDYNELQRLSCLANEEPSRVVTKIVLAALRTHGKQKRK